MAEGRGSFRYLTIADTLRARLRREEFPPGRPLPSEAELSVSFGASRVTVRKALEALREEGLVDSRQGYGWFVPVDPLRQTLGRLGTIEAQLAASGVTPDRRILDFGFRRAPRAVAARLGADRVLEIRRVNLADGEPFARVTVWVPEDLAGDLSRSAVERTSLYELLPVEIGRATQSIAAAAASEEDAEILGIPSGAPVLRCVRSTYSSLNRMVLMSEFVFAAHRTEFVVDLPQVSADAEPSLAPSGLRLVEAD